MDRVRHHTRLGWLRDRIALSFALEDALVEDLSDRGARLRRGGQLSAAREAEQAVLRHHADRIALRARFVSLGIEI